MQFKIEPAMNLVVKPNLLLVTRAKLRMPEVCRRIYLKISVCTVPSVRLRACNL